MSDEVTQYAILTFEWQRGIKPTKLILRGPTVPGVDAAPVIGARLDAKGSYRFVIGVGEYIYEPRDIPKEIQKLIGGGVSGDKHANGPKTPVLMPSIDQLQQTDGSFKSYYQYRLNWSYVPPPTNPGAVQSPLPPALYCALIDLYCNRMPRPLPPFELKLKHSF